MQITRVMRRPIIRKVEPIAPTYERCSGCVSRKMCDEQSKCVHGMKKKPKGKKKNVRANG